MLAGTKKTSLKSNLSIKARAKKGGRVSLDKKTASQLVKVADEAFSKYIRLRDSEWDVSKTKRLVSCIDCEKPGIVYENGHWKKGIDNGHYVSRGIMSLRYDDINCNAQNSHCNAWRDKADVEADYSKALDRKYGKGTAQALREASKLPNSRKMPPKAELLDIITTCRAYIKRTLGE